MLQRIEDFYLTILRVVAILVAGLLLLVVVIAATKSVGALWSSEPLGIVPTVSDADLKKSIFQSGDASSANRTAETAGQYDPNQTYYNRTAVSITDFFDALFPGAYKIPTVGLAKFLKQNADAYEDPEIRSAFARNLSERIDSLLADEKIVAYAKSSEPSETIDRIIQSFVREFDRQIVEAESKNRAAQEAHLAETAKAQQNLYLSAASFCVFLLVVFLSIIVRIERNLRPQNRPAN